MLRLTVLLLSLVLFACNAKQPLRESNYLNSGSITLAGKVPLALEIDFKPLLGFMPFSNDALERIEIDFKEQKILVKKGSIITLESKALIGEKVSPGIKTVSFTEESPIWYADDKYYTDRKLDIPAKGAKERYLKGILGQNAIYLEDGTLLYFSKYSVENGIALPKSAYQELKNKIILGTQLAIN